VTSAALVETDKPILYLMRWIAAAFVAIGHVYSTIFHPYESGYASLLGTGDVSWSSSTGGFLEHIALMRSGAVIVFFVMSGYLVGGSVLGSSDNFAFGRYFINRFSRIYIVLLPAILLTGGLDLAAYSLAPDNQVYTTPALASSIGITDSVFYRYDAQSILSTLLALDSIIGNPMGSNVALWSLGVEWFFYFLFPATVLLLGKRLKIFGPIAPILAVVIVAAILAAIGQRYLAVFWIIWTAGAFCSRIRFDGSHFPVHSGVCPCHRPCRLSRLL
jgi:peptidoglycan/LPS O-acetylase OafA/YrhL